MNNEKENERNIFKNVRFKITKNYKWNKLF